MKSSSSGPHAGVGQFSSGEVGPTLNYFGLHHMWSNLIGPHLASLLEPLTICHFEVEGTGNTAPRTNFIKHLVELALHTK